MSKELILIHVKGRETSTLLIDKKMYEKNKKLYDEKNYIIASDEILENYIASNPHVLEGVSVSEKSTPKASKSTETKPQQKASQKSNSETKKES